jgi:AcrR family transcriptional regulator
MRDGARTKARIETEALRLFAERGIDGTSIRDIAAAVGVAEGALYRHFPGKEHLAREIFLAGYADLAGKVHAAGATGRPFEHIVGDVIAIFCALFDSDRPLFSFLLLSQHAFLADVPAGSEANVVEAVAGIFRDAMIRGRIPQADADLIAAMALGIVAQPATFILYGRLEGPLSQRMPALAAAVLAAAGAGAPRTALLRRAASAP